MLGLLAHQERRHARSSALSAHLLFLGCNDPTGGHCGHARAPCDRGNLTNAPFAESHVEEAPLAWLAELGYATANGLDTGPDGARPERANYGDVVLADRLRAAIARLNSSLPRRRSPKFSPSRRRPRRPALIEENRRLHRYLIEGVPVEVKRADGCSVARRSRAAGGERAAASDAGDRLPRERVISSLCTDDDRIPRGVEGNRVCRG